MRGDCDVDDDCYGSMVCGTDNCDWDEEDSGLDCCVYP